MTDNPYLQWPVFRRSIVAAFGRSLTLAENPTPERLLQYLCSYKGSSETETLKSRYRAISNHDRHVHVSPEEPGLIENLYRPLHYAKIAYVLGDAAGTIAHCGMIAERVAILLHQLDHTDEAERTRFERLDQWNRVDELKGRLSPELVGAFGELRAIRREFLHLWVRDSARSSQQALRAYARAVQLVTGAIAMPIRNGVFVLDDRVARYLLERGTLRDRPSSDSLPEDVE